MKKTKSELSGLKNIGATIEKRLNEIGIYSKKDLQKMGAVKAYKKIKQKNSDKTIPVCYYLYSFQGALEEKHWNDISEKTKKNLLQKINK
ncbi:MAG: TfoX/Sxy family protein [Nitrosopumilus sp.]|uniref:TfoX/Sxy family protein n=1 Tax=Nitrosopumilus sp. TaxID=2024843 RepID=UPI00243096E1|nr:TfoX/Sxy family protein [Nitrosopumilus sp.]MCV0366190.1 TfoX/Sxy family protein [Nitrosopumilus sp.]